MRNSIKALFFFLLLFGTTSCDIKKSRNFISLKGEWSFKIDSLSVGEEEGWFYKSNLESEEVVLLPGTTDTNEKGISNIESKETTHLTRKFKYVGKAWYQKKVNIPSDWTGKNMTLFMERTKPSKVWIDGKLVGSSSNISTPHIFDISNFMTMGEHTITVMIDNKEGVPPQLIDNSHAYTESTQTNWNGIIGDIHIESKPKININRVDVYPDLKNKTSKIKISFNSESEISGNAEVKAVANLYNTTRKHSSSFRNSVEINNNVAIFELPLGENMACWSEFDPALYKLDVEVTINNIYDRVQTTFGVRDFSKEGTQFTINGKKTFLRGKHDACVFPLTGHVAMDKDEWIRYFSIAKSYGINHYRFHSWCPPKACFEAADEAGIYLQPELPFWGTINANDSSLINFLVNEGVNVQTDYSNHPSFVLFAIGNELSGDRESMIKMIDTFRKVDNRHLYATGSNNFLGYYGPAEGDDFFVTCRVPGNNTIENHARASFSFADAVDGGYLNSTYPNTCQTLVSAVKQCNVPLVSHETGQFQVYPDYSQMEKYTGVLIPNNLEIFRQRLVNSGMENQAMAFSNASGKWAMQLYRAELEMDFRTRGLAGFQLLDIQDYPGQGSAYVGVLDAFMDSKGIISDNEWRMFCNDIVLLFSTNKLCYSSDETLSGEFIVSNFSADNLENKNLTWKLTNCCGDIFDEGSINMNVSQGELSEIGKLNIDLSKVDTARKLILSLKLDETEYCNQYDFWVYPSDNKKTTVPEGIAWVSELDFPIFDLMSKGKKVLLTPDLRKIKNNSVGGLFQTDYWNYRMFKHISEICSRPVSPGTLGLLMDPTHPLFKDFPTQEHTSWQWFDATKNSRPLILDNLPKDYLPIVQVIDNIERNHKLGMIMEFKIGEGSLLLVTSDLKKYQDKPEGRQLLKSILNYMESDKFNPEFSISQNDFIYLLTGSASKKQIKDLMNISYE